MKRYVLVKVASYLKRFRKIFVAERVEDTVIRMVFDKKESIYFDMKKGSSSIYKSKEQKRAKSYNAPFDVVLRKKVANSIIEDVEVLEGNRILRFTLSQDSKYKRERLYFQLEFTGRNTNAIIMDENFIVLEALRHIDKSVSFREIQTGVKLLDLPPFEFKEKEEEIGDIEEYLYKVYEKKEKELLERLRNQKLSFLFKKREKLLSLLDGMEDEEEILKRSERFSKEATLILSNLHQIKDYQKEVVLRDFDGEEIKISFPKNARTPQEAANILFNWAKKLKQKAKYSHIERENLKSKIEFLDRKIEMVRNAKSSDEINILFPKREKKSKKEKERDYESYFLQDYKIMVGKSEKGNIELLKNAKMSDIWMHLKDMPSTHVIIRTDKKRVPREVLEFAAKLCVDYSVSQKGSYLVDYTQRRNVKIRERAFVNYVDYDTIKVIKD
ncbi:MAG: DUF814 domain-containing protein [Epsilonproteobacteria bacterium]|nr:DUF814 domain-containing protein [Campylobacterota bacterium]